MGGDTEKSGRDIDHVTPASQLLGKEVRDQSAFNNASSTSINNVEFESTQHPFAIDLKAPISGQRAQDTARPRIYEHPNPSSKYISVMQSKCTPGGHHAH